MDWPDREHVYGRGSCPASSRILRDPDNGLSVGQGADPRLHPEKLPGGDRVRLLEAIDADDADMLREELGDVLMQVAFHVVLEEETRAAQL